jgi:hypothetical protein
MHGEFAQAPLTDYGSEYDETLTAEEAAYAIHDALPVIGFKADALDYYAKNAYLHVSPKRLLSTTDIGTTILDFARRCLAGTYPTWLRSVPPPAPDADAAVVEVVGSTAGSAVFGGDPRGIPTASRVSRRGPTRGRAPERKTWRDSPSLRASGSHGEPSNRARSVRNPRFRELDSTSGARLSTRVPRTVGRIPESAQATTSARRRRGPARSRPRAAGGRARRCSTS